MDENKVIAKEILLKIIEENLIKREEFPEAKTVVDLVCEAYKKILKAVRES